MFRIPFALLFALTLLVSTLPAAAQGLSPDQPCLLDTAECIDADQPRLIDQPTLIDQEVPLIDQQQGLVENQPRLIDQDACVLADATCVDLDSPRLIDQPSLIDQQQRLIDQPIPCVLASLQCTDLDEPSFIEQDQPCVLATADCTTLPPDAAPVNLVGPFAGTWSGSYTGPYRSNLARCQGTASGTARLVLDQPSPTAPVTGTLSYGGAVTCGGNTSVDNCDNSRVGPVAVADSRIQFPNNCDQSTVILLIDSPTALSGTDTFRDNDESWETRISLTRG